MRAPPAYAILALVLGLAARVEPVERVRPAHRDEYRALVHRATVTATKRVDTAMPDARGRAHDAIAALPPRWFAVNDPDRPCTVVTLACATAGAGVARPIRRGARAPPPG